MKQILSQIKNDRDLELIVLWHASPQANTKILESTDMEQVNLSQPNGMQVKTSSKGAISIYDCLSCFSMEETLTGNDKWYCS